VELATPSSAEVKERVELYFYSHLSLHVLLKSEIFLLFRIKRKKQGTGELHNEQLHTFTVQEILLEMVKARWRG
jgi:hypothetical protein